MFIETLHSFINLLKNQGQARYYPPEEITSAFNAAQLDKFREDYKSFEDSQEITDALRLFKTEFEYETPAETLPLPSNYAHITEFSIEKDSVEYPGKVVTDDLWNIRELSQLQKAFRDNIEPFKHSEEINLTSGVGDLPGDYVDKIAVDAFTNDSYSSPVDITNENHFVTRKNDSTYPPTESYPIGWIGGGKINIAPSTISKVKLYYYRYPVMQRPIGKIFGSNLLVKPYNGVDSIFIRYLKLPTDTVYAYTIENGRDIVFNETGSTDTEYGPLEHTSLVIKTLRYLGISLKDEYLLQFENLKSDIKTEGNG